MSSFSDRLTRVEEKIQQMATTQDTILQILEELKAQQFSLTLAAAKNIQCPSPGLCQKLEERLQEDEDRIKSLEIIATKLSGAGAVTQILWTILLSVGTLYSIKTIFFK